MPGKGNGHQAPPFCGYPDPRPQTPPLFQDHARVAFGVVNFACRKKHSALNPGVGNAALVRVYEAWEHEEPPPPPPHSRARPAQISPYAEGVSK